MQLNNSIRQIFGEYLLCALALVKRQVHITLPIQKRPFALLPNKQKRVPMNSLELGGKIKLCSVLLFKIIFILFSADGCLP